MSPLSRKRPTLAPTVAMDTGVRRPFHTGRRGACNQFRSAGAGGLQAPVSARLVSAIPEHRHIPMARFSFGYEDKTPSANTFAPRAAPLSKVIDWPRLSKCAAPALLFAAISSGESRRDGGHSPPRFKRFKRQGHAPPCRRTHPRVTRAHCPALTGRRFGSLARSRVCCHIATLSPRSCADKRQGPLETFTDGSVHIQAYGDHCRARRAKNSF